jgi:hypothetical protein
VAGSASAAASLALTALRSRPLLLRIWPDFGLSALPLRVAGWRANDLWPRTRHLPQPHRPIESLAYNFFDCRHRGSLAASTQVNHAPRVRQPPSIFSTYAPRLERVLLTRGDGVLHIKICLGITSQSFLLVVGHHIAIVPLEPTTPERGRSSGSRGKTAHGSNKGAPAPDREPQTGHPKHDTRPVTAVRFASIDVEIRT